MRITPVEPDRAPDVVKRIYDSLSKASPSGTVSPFMKMLGHKPDVLRAYNQLSAAVLAEGALSPRLKELAYLRASILNGCHYWTRAHTASGKRRGITDEQIAALKEPGGRSGAAFSEEERAVLRFTDLLTSWPGNMAQSDLDALGEHLSEEQIVELVFVVATANWTNRVNDGLQTPLPS
jgi:4-carboxymuconolactone decarboxylase